MASEYDWHVGEDDPQLPADASKKRPRYPLRSKVKRVFALLVVVVAPLCIGLIWWLWAQVDRAEDSVIQDVAASFELLWQATTHSDGELFRSLHVQYSGEGWDDEIDQLFDAGMFFDRSAFGLKQAGPPEIIETAVSSDLLTAQLVAEQEFIVELEPGSRQNVTLRYTYSYVNVGARWLLSPPGQEYWGEKWRIDETARNLKLVYSEPDRPVAERLGQDLDDLLTLLCRQVDEADLASPTCSSLFPLKISLRREPNRLLPGFIGTSGGMFNATPVTFLLPSPALFGLPGDEAGYEALYRGYGRELVKLVWRQLVREELRDGSFDSQLSDAIVRRLSLNLGLRYWPPAALQTSSASRPSRPPEEDLLLMCAGPTAGGGALYRYDFSNESWSGRLPIDGYTLLQGSAGFEGVLLQSGSGGNEDSLKPVLLWPDGMLLELPTIQDLEEAGDLPHFDYDLKGNLVVAGGYTSEYAWTGTFLLNLDQCRLGNCQWTGVPGDLNWSPDHQHFFSSAPMGTVELYDIHAKPLPGPENAFMPRWLDASSYVYFHVPDVTAAEEGNMDQVRISTSTIDDPTPRLLFTYQDMAAAMHQAGAGNAGMEWLASMLEFSYWLPPAGNQELTFFTTAPEAAFAQFEESNDPVLLKFSVNTQTNEISATLLTDGEIPTSIIRSDLGIWSQIGGAPSNGRFLVDISYPPAELRWQDVGNGNIGSVPLLSPSQSLFEWSDDGRWLLLFQEGVPILIAPEHDYWRFALPEGPDCYGAAWIGRSPSPADGDR